MKIKVEVQPKEWMLMAAFILVICLLLTGKAEDAISAIKYWLKH